MRTSALRCMLPAMAVALLTAAVPARAGFGWNGSAGLSLQRTDTWSNAGADSSRNLLWFTGSLVLDASFFGPGVLDLGASASYLGYRAQGGTASDGLNYRLTLGALRNTPVSLGATASRSTIDFTADTAAGRHRLDPCRLPVRHDRHRHRRHPHAGGLGLPEPVHQPEHRPGAGQGHRHRAASRAHPGRGGAQLLPDLRHPLGRRRLRRDQLPRPRRDAPGPGPARPQRHGPGGGHLHAAPAHRVEPAQPTRGQPVRLGLDQLGGQRYPERRRRLHVLGLPLRATRQRLAPEHHPLVQRLRLPPAHAGVGVQRQRVGLLVPEPRRHGRDQGQRRGRGGRRAVGAPGGRSTRSPPAPTAASAWPSPRPGPTRPPTTSAAASTCRGRSAPGPAAWG